MSIGALVTPVSTVADPLHALQQAVSGEVITMTSETYDEARKAVNMLLDRRPGAIVQARTAEDVAATVQFAREQGLAVAVRSGGHSLAQYSVIDDGIVIDLSRMKRVVINPVTSTARVQAGATSGDVGAAAHEHGLALTTGDTASVGIGGLTTGGGIGFMVRKYGLTIDNLLAAQVVLASGEIVTANKDENPDLFWAIRGGGGNFGVITEFTFQLAPVDQVLAGMLFLPVNREIVRGYLEYSATAPDDLTTIANLMYAPPAPFVPAELVGKPVLAIIANWTGTEEDGRVALAPLRALATPLVDTIGLIPYPAIYAYTDHQSLPHGASIRMMFANELSDAAIDAMIDALAAPSSPFALVHLRGLGGAMARVDRMATAFAHRTQKYFVSIINVWLDPSEDQSVHAAWTENLWDSIKHEGSGAYVNFLEREGDDRIRQAYPAETYEWLARVKAKYDPDNVFRNNQNVTPKQ